MQMLVSLFLFCVVLKNLHLTDVEVIEDFSFRPHCRPIILRILLLRGGL